MDNDDVSRIMTALNNEPTFDATLEVHAAKLPCLESYLNGQQLQPRAILESRQREKGESSGASAIHESRQREKGETSGEKCQLSSRDFVAEGSPTKGKQITEVVNKGMYDKEDRFEYQNMSLQCGPQLGQPTELLNEPQTYLGLTPSNHKKAMGGSWQVYSRGSWSHRRHQRRGSLEGSHMPPNNIQQSSSRNISRSETGDIITDLEQEASGDSTQTQEAFKMWKMIQQLGVTTGNNQDVQHREILQKLSSMETRDRLEAERLGANVRDP